MLLLNQVAKRAKRIPLVDNSERKRSLWGKFENFSFTEILFVGMMKRSKVKLEKGDQDEAKIVRQNGKT